MDSHQFLNICHTSNELQAVMKWSGGLVDGLSSSWTETTATEPLRCSKKLCILCVCMIILCSLKPHHQTCKRCLKMSTKIFIGGGSQSAKYAHCNYDCFVDKYPNFKWIQLVYVPICNGLLCSPSFVFSIIKHCQTSLACLLLPLQHYTNKPHLTHTTPQLTRPCS